MRRRRLAGVVTAGALALAPAALALPPGAPALPVAQQPAAQQPAAHQRAAHQPAAQQPVDEPAVDGVQVTLDAVGPARLLPGGTLTVQATVRNGTETAVEDAVARLRVRSQRSATRAALDSWVEGDNGDGRERDRVLLPPVPAGESRAVELSVPADELDLSSDPFQWGPRGLAVEVVGADRSPLDITRSFVVWEPAPGGYEPTEISVVVPLTDGPPAVTAGRIPAEQLVPLTSEGGRLRAVLDAASVPGVTWVLDPALLDPAVLDPGLADPSLVQADEQDAGGTTAPATTTPATPGPTGTPSNPPQPGPVQDWLSALLRAAEEHEVIALPYGDPDVNALAHTELEQAYALAEVLGRETAQEHLGEPARTDVAWPVSGSLDADTLAMLVEAGRTSVLLSGGAQPPARPLGTTPTGRSSLRTGEEVAAGLLVDTPLSSTLAAVDQRHAAEPAEGAAGSPDVDVSEEGRGPAALTQRLLAETAAITLERPFDPRHVVVTAPRGWDPAAADAVRAVQALTSAPWLDVQPLGELVDAPVPDLERQDLRYPPSDLLAELPAEGLRAAMGALRSVRITSTALADPDPAAAAAERALVAASSSAWRDRLDEWSEQVAELARQAQERANAVRVLEGSGITVVSSNVRLPVTVENTLDETARVTIRLRPRSTRLVVPDTVTVTVPPNSQQRVSVPVEAVGNGNTDVLVELLTPAGLRLGEPVTMTVRVRADWETWGTLVIGVLVGLVLVTGVVRSIRRGRRRSELENPVARPRHDHHLEDRR